MSAILSPINFLPGSLDFVRDFDCGKTHDHQIELSDWIAKESVHALANGTSIWLYKIQEEIAGFGALGLGELELDTGEIVEVQNIPALAVHVRHQGQGFFHQIVDHVIEQAKSRINISSPLLTLEVRPENFIKESYRKKGFDYCPGADYFDKQRNIAYLGMIMNLRRK